MGQVPEEIQARLNTHTTEDIATIEEDMAQW
jgi:hypothetical protein